MIDRIYCSESSRGAITQDTVLRRRQTSSAGRPTDGVPLSRPRNSIHVRHIFPQSAPEDLFPEVPMAQYHPPRPLREKQVPFPHRPFEVMVRQTSRVQHV